MGQLSIVTKNGKYFGQFGTDRWVHGMYRSVVFTETVGGGGGGKMWAGVQVCSCVCVYSCACIRVTLMIDLQFMHNRYWY